MASTGGVRLAALVAVVVATAWAFKRRRKRTLLAPLSSTPDTAPSVGCEPAPTEQPPPRLSGTRETVVRAALDIGSANHKLCVAEVERVSHAIVRVVHSEQRQVMLKHALLQSADGRLDDETLRDSRAVLAGFREAALAAGATRFAGVATAVFRRALNGEAYLADVNRSLRLRLRVISQRLEGELGHLSASCGLPPSASCARLLCDAAGGVSHAPRAPMLAWDSGGGSFQLSGRVDGQLCVWEGPLGDADVAAMLLHLQGRPMVGVAHGVRTSPNPVSLDDARRLADTLDDVLPPAPGWLVELCRTPGAQIVGYGEATSLCALPSQLHGGAARLTAEMVWDAIERCVGRTDAQLLAAHGDLHDEEDLALPKLVLMHTMMRRRLAVGDVRYVRTNGNCQGVLRCAELWQPGPQRRASKEGYDIPPPT
jgi:hypothetical protein